MKILHVAETIKGGIATVLSELIPAQIGAVGQDNVFALIPAEQQGELPEMKSGQFKTFPRQKRGIAALIAMAMKLYEILCKEEPDILHLHSSFAGCVGQIVAQFAPKKPVVIYCAHGWAFTMNVSPVKKAIYGLVERILAGARDGIINISDYEARAAMAQEIPVSKMRTIYNGIKPLMDVVLQKMRRGTDKKIFLFVGRFDEQKGIDLLIRALEKIPSPDFIVQVVGEGVLQSGPVHFPACMERLGWKKRDHMPEIYYNADALIVPSRWEGFGLVAIEAMSCGTPVMASIHGALPEIVTDAETGFLFDPFDPDQLAGLLGQLNAVDLAGMGQKAAIDMRRRFTSSLMNKAVLDYYKDCLNIRQGQ